MKKLVETMAMVVFLAVFVCVAGPTIGQCEEESEEQMTIGQVPAPVKATIEKETAGATVKEIVKEVEDGETVYEAVFTKDGKTFEVEIAPDGSVLEREQSDDNEKEDDDDDDEDAEESEEMIAFADAPEAVQKTMKREGAGDVSQLEKEVEKGQTVYEAEIQIDGKPYEIEVLEDGTLLAKVLDMDDDDEEDDDDDD